MSEYQSFIIVTETMEELLAIGLAREVKQQSEREKDWTKISSPPRKPRPGNNFMSHFVFKTKYSV